MKVLVGSMVGCRRICRILPAGTSVNLFGHYVQALDQGRFCLLFSASESLIPGMIPLLYGNREADRRDRYQKSLRWMG